MSQDGKRDLDHFLNLAGQQLRHRLKKAEESEGYTPQTNRMRLLLELIKEQVPLDGNETVSRHSAGKAG